MFTKLFKYKSCNYEFDTNKQLQHTILISTSDRGRKRT